MPNQKHILIIEDEIILGELLKNRLEKEGYKVSWEKDGDAGLSAMHYAKPDLILLDILMPRKDGYEVLEDMRNDSELKEIPVIVISNSGQPVEISRILEFGVKDYIIKADFSPTEVLQKVHNYINISSLKRYNDADISIISKPILIVEDDPFLSSIIAEHIKKNGYIISSVNDGGSALKWLEKEVPDLILLDLVMPGLSGFDVLKKIRADERLKDVIVIIFSNLGQDHEIEESKKLGADAFLIKVKSTPSEVLKKIETLLKEKKYKKNNINS